MKKNKTIPQEYYAPSSGYHPPLDFERACQIPADAPVVILYRLLQRLDFTAVDETYSPLGRKPALPPMTMFAILAYGYFCNAHSSRKIHRLCVRDIHFLWLLQGNDAPSHQAINTFRKDHLGNGVMEDLFDQLVRELIRYGEIPCENLFIDGTKLEASANPYSWVWMRAVSNYRAKLHADIKLALLYFATQYGFRYSLDAELPLETIWRLHDQLESLAGELGTPFVKGSGKRKPAIQKDLELVRDWIVRETRYVGYVEIAGERSSFSKTDRDATFMRLKKDHMKNDQLKPAYNCQVGIEAGYFVHMAVFQYTNDHLTLKPFLSTLEERPGIRHPNICTDSGYESEEDYAFLSERGQDSYIKPANHEQAKKAGKKRKSTASWVGKREDMAYNAEEDSYTCANGKLLKNVGIKKEKTKTGYVREVTIYQCDECSGCPYRARCSKAKQDNSKQLSVSKKFVAWREESQRNITTEFGTRLRMNRSIQAEGAFGWIKADYGFRRFLTRGVGNVGVELLLFGFSLNVKKFHNKLARGKTGTYLHELKSA